MGVGIGKGEKREEEANFVKRPAWKKGAPFHIFYSERARWPV